MTELAKQPIPPHVEEMIDQATRLLVEPAHPERIILFGSYSRGDFDKDSDLDFLVIFPTIEDRFAEMARLRLVLRDLPMAIDLVVYACEDITRRGHLRGTMLYHALREGKVLYGTSAGEISGRSRPECRSSAQGIREPWMTPRDRALELLRLARQDEQAAHILDSSAEASEAIIGFHYQQAVEKALNAVLAERDVDFPKTHDLAQLLKLVRTEGYQVPVDEAVLIRLAPFAVTMRYEDVEEPGPLEGTRTKTLVRGLLDWAERVCVPDSR